MVIIKPSGVSMGGISHQPITSMDLYTTLLEPAGLPMKQDQHVDGRSLFHYLKSPGKITTRTLVWHYPHYHGSTWRPGSAIRQNNWKLIEFYEEEKVELYDLSKDISEQHNVAEAHPDTAADLGEKMHDYIEAGEIIILRLLMIKTTIILFAGCGIWWATSP